MQVKQINAQIKKPANGRLNQDVITNLMLYTGTATYRTCADIRIGPVAIPF